METKEEIESAKIVYAQLKLINEQKKDEIPMQHVKIRCCCNELVSWKYAYKCLYCGVWFCKECAESHFGKTIEQYRSEDILEDLESLSNNAGNMGEVYSESAIDDFIERLKKNQR